MWAFDRKHGIASCLFLTACSKIMLRNDAHHAEKDGEGPAQLSLDAPVVRAPRGSLLLRRSGGGLIP